MNLLLFSKPRDTSSARLHSSVHCSTSILRGRRSVTLLHMQTVHQLCNVARYMWLSSWEHNSNVHLSAFSLCGLRLVMCLHKKQHAFSCIMMCTQSAAALLNTYKRCRLLNSHLAWPDTHHAPAYTNPSNPDCIVFLWTIAIAHSLHINVHHRVAISCGLKCFQLLLHRHAACNLLHANLCSQMQWQCWLHSSVHS